MESEWRFNVWRTGLSLPGPLPNALWGKALLVGELITPVLYFGRVYRWLVQIEYLGFTYTYFGHSPLGDCVTILTFIGFYPPPFPALPCWPD